MIGYGFTLFLTALGRCGIAWSERGITRLQLPEPSDAATRQRLIRNLAVAVQQPPPPAVQAVIDKVVGLLAGEARDLRDVALDVDGVPPFHRRVHAVVRQIPVGETLSYGEVAARVGEPGAARAVGQAMGRNPYPIIVPCHRVLAAGGRAGGFTAPGGLATKARLLQIEGARWGREPDLFAAASIGAH